MSENKEKYQQQILFGDDELAANNVEENTPQIIVEESDLLIEEQTEANSIEVTNTIAEPKKAAWLWRGLSAVFVILIIIETVQFFVNGFAKSPWLAGLYAVLLAGLSIILLRNIWRELIGFRQLKVQQNLQQQARNIINADSTKSTMSATNFCEKLSKRLPCDTAQYEQGKWNDIAIDELNDAEILQLYSRNILSQVDKKAINEIANFSTESVVLIALSPIAVLDMLIILWRNLRLINKIASLYGLKLGYWSQVKLIKQVVINMAYAGTSELIADLSTDLLGAELLGKLSARMAQGLGAGMLTARLGLKTMNMCRPIPFDSSGLGEDKPKLAHVRQQIVKQVKQLLLKTS